MGNNESVQSKSNAEVFQAYQLIGVEDNPKFGDISLYKDKSTGQMVWIKEIMLDENNSEGVLDSYVASNGWKDPNFITQQVFKIVPKESFFCSANCNSSKRLVVIMDYFDRDLEYEVNQRASEADKDYFPEAEVWYIIESIMVLQSVVLKHNRFHGDLRTGNIFITEDGQTKFVDPSLLDHDNSTYIKVMTGETRANISPEVVQALQSSQREAKTNPELVDVFAIGIILLALATLHEDSYYYDWSRKDIIWRNVRESLDEIQLRYSPLLHQLAKGCLQERMSERIHMTDILQFVEKRKQTTN